MFKIVLITTVAFVLSQCCDIIVHVKSNTDKAFEAQVIAPNGKKSEMWKFTKKLERNTFQQKANECGVGDWKIITYDNGKQIYEAKAGLDGIGRVVYMVGDDLKAVQKKRQGAACTGQCAPLANVAQRPHKPQRTSKSPPTQQ